MKQKSSTWHGTCDLRFFKRSESQSLVPQTIYQGICRAPFKLMRSSSKPDGWCELPILHTAGGLVGGDQLTLKVIAEEGSRCHLTTVAAQKVYGTVGRSRVNPQGQWAKQNCHIGIHNDSHVEWLPQEVIVFANGLFEQKTFVELPLSSSFLGAEIVRLGRTASGESLDSGCWRSSLEISRKGSTNNFWEFVDRLELSGDALTSLHGMAGRPVLGSLVWVAPEFLSKKDIEQLLVSSLDSRSGLEGFMSCSLLRQGISARYLGPSTQSARFWFFRIWTEIRKLSFLKYPEAPRVWPIQENPFSEKYPNKSFQDSIAVRM